MSAHPMRTRVLLILAPIVLVLLFLFQNSASVDVKLLFWTLVLPRSALIFTALFIGIIIGWFARPMFRPKSPPG